MGACGRCNCISSYCLRCSAMGMYDGTAGNSSSPMTNTPAPKTTASISFHSQTRKLTHIVGSPPSTRRLRSRIAFSSSTASPPGAVLARSSPLRSSSTFSHDLSSRAFALLTNEPGSPKNTPTRASTRSTSTRFPTLPRSSASAPCPLSSSSRTARRSERSSAPTPRPSRRPSSLTSARPPHR